MSNNEEFLLKWNNHQSNLIGVFKDWLQDESFVDVTLVCGGEAVSGHKVVLAACSPLLNRILHDNPCRHPVVILNDVCSTDMKALLKFIYQGEVSVSQNELASFLKTADNLQIKGLAEGRDEEKKRKDDAVGCGIRKKRKTEARLGTSIQQAPQTQRKKEEYISTSPNCQSQNTCLLNSSTNEVSPGTTFSNSLNPQVENSKLTNSNLQSDSSNSSVSLPKESMLGQNVSRGTLGGVDGANGGGFKDLVEDSPDFTVKEENDDQYYSDENPPQSFNASDSENLTCKRGLQMISKNSFNSGSESYSLVTPFTPSSSGSYYIRNGALLCCKSCPYQSINPYTFNRHLRIHVGNKEFKCDHCDYATTRKDSLIRHSRVKH
ncbi:Longitudinals lacking protein-like [Armadillidium nasatum]|uniref:Longitudinals lacking protein-like n=1 Tax=Armadillidium nasatum TaxID=96803 RepID=A0A5N5TF01_9CRUS|nr:Longitudinals lacking protein-like [Armadillidium nasatum]